MVTSKDVTTMLNDRAMLQILKTTYNKAKTVHQLVEETGIPIASCYRKIHFMIEIKAIVVSDEHRTTRGKPLKFYKSNVTALRTHYNGHVQTTSIDFMKGKEKNFSDEI